MQKTKTYIKICWRAAQWPVRPRVCKCRPRRASRLTWQRALVRPRSLLYRGVRKGSRGWVYKPVRLPFGRRGGTKSSTPRVRWQRTTSCTGWSHQTVLKAVSCHPRCAATRGALYLVPPRRAKDSRTGL